MEDFDLIISAKKRNEAIIDLVINHTSDEHPWFIESKPKDSKREIGISERWKRWC